MPGFLLFPHSLFISGSKFLIYMKNLESINRYENPSIIAPVLSKENSGTVERIMWDCPIEEYILDGADKTLQTFLAKGHHVAVFSGEYFKRVGRSGIGKKFRQELPRLERQRFSVFTATAEDDKMAFLPHLVDQTRKNHNITTIAIVDNTREKLEKAAHVIEENALDADFKLVWINNEVPFSTTSPFSLSSRISWTSIPDITELEKEVTSNEDKKLMLAVDWNHTIIDTDRWERDMQYSVSNFLQNQQILTESLSYIS
jgi:hypothetical protein